MTRLAGWSWKALGASVAAHGLALTTALGHPAATGPVGPANPPPVVEIALDPVVDPTAPPPLDEPMKAGAVAHATHTHPYPVPASHDDTPHDPSLVHVFPATHTHATHDDPAEPSTVQAAPTSEPLPTFVIAVGDPASPGKGTGEATNPPAAPGGASSIETERSVSTPARMIRGLSPGYPAEARAQGIEAAVPLEIVVGDSGSVESARCLEHAGFGFDEAAVAAIRQYRFEPATRAGHAVRVRMRWTMEFRLR